MSIFSSARTKLTIGYTLFFAIVIWIFSAVFYVVQLRTLYRTNLIPQRVLNRAAEQLQRTPANQGMVGQVLEERLEDVTTELRHQLFTAVMIFDLIAIMSSAVVSYYLAGKSLEPLENAFELQQQFLADASHELRTPLSVMQTEVDLALRQKRLPVKTKQTYVSLRQEIRSMSQLVSNILFLSRTGQQAQVNSAAKVDVVSVIRASVAKFKTQAKEKKVALTYRSSLDQLVIPTNGELWSKLVTILVENALKYTDIGEISVAVWTEHQHLHMSVSDTGMGIDKKELSHIFERFYRSDKARSSEGTGLGLSIADEIVHQLGGSISVKSDLGKGTTFSVKVAV